MLPRQEAAYPPFHKAKLLYWGGGAYLYGSESASLFSHWENIPKRAAGGVVMLIWFIFPAAPFIPN